MTSLVRRIPLGPDDEHMRYGEDNDYEEGELLR
jgi:hypothetical protein